MQLYFYTKLASLSIIQRAKHRRDVNGAYHNLRCHSLAQVWQINFILQACYIFEPAFSAVLGSCIFQTASPEGVWLFHARIAPPFSIVLVPPMWERKFRPHPQTCGLLIDSTKKMMVLLSEESTVMSVSRIRRIFRQCALVEEAPEVIVAHFAMVINCYVFVYAIDSFVCEANPAINERCVVPLPKQNERAGLGWFDECRHVERFVFEDATTQKEIFIHIS